MVYLHEVEYSNNLVERWANETTDYTDKTPTHQIHKVGTDEYYDLAVDFTNKWRVEHGLAPLKYEIAGKIEEQSDDIAEEQQDINA